MENKIYQLVYVSYTRKAFSEPALFSLLKKSRIANQRNNLSGFLLYSEKNFIQLIEGEKNKVESLYDKITHDPRHSGIIRLYSDYVAKRDFPDWSMGFEHLEHRTVLKQVRGLNHLTDHYLSDDDKVQLDEVSQEISTLIKVFRTTSHLDC